MFVIITPLERDHMSVGKHSITAIYDVLHNEKKIIIHHKNTEAGHIASPCLMFVLMLTPSVLLSDNQRAE